MTRPWYVFPAPSVGIAWQERAACAGHPEPELWFPIVRGPPTEVSAASERARQICAGCPVSEQCEAYVLELEGPYEGWRGRFGIWAGLGPRARQRIARERRADVA